MFLGTSEGIERVCRLAVDHGLRMDFVVADEKSMPEGHHDISLETKAYDYVVYDIGAYSYEKILQLIARKKMGKRSRLATFSTETSRMITLKKVY